MYVISSMPLEQQSLAGGIFQTMSRLGGTIGSGITTAIFNAIANSPPTTGYYANDSVAPYAGTYWYAFGASCAAFVLCFFLRIGTQGAKASSSSVVPSEHGDKAVVEEKAMV